MEKANSRISGLSSQMKESIKPQINGHPMIIEHDDNLSHRLKYEWFKWNGWGYLDTKFITEKNHVLLTGSRYTFSGIPMPDFKKFLFENEDFKMLKHNIRATPQEKMDISPPIINEEFLNALGEEFSRLSFYPLERIMHSHGHTLQELYILKTSKFERFADCVIYPRNHEQVVKLVECAVEHNVVLIPYGGGTNVTEALLLDNEEGRMIVSVDMGRMNHIKWVDKANSIACVEAGIIGQQLDRELHKYGLCTGHEPDSVEFSTLGGWVSTRASGMKKNCYGNIEDMTQNIKCVTPIGVIEKSKPWPRVSNGPDINHILMGMEGQFGIITEVTLRLRKLPEAREYDSLIFPDFIEGSKFMMNLAQKRIFPASVRLVDNLQFHVANGMKAEAKSPSKKLMEKVKKYYLTKVKGFDLKKISVATILFEGMKEEVELQKRQLHEIAKIYGGVRAGPENGIRGYFLTFVVAYLRDYMMEHKSIAESFETSVPWNNVMPLCENTRNRILESAKNLGIKEEPFITFRITQLYETGAAVYVYFGFTYEGLDDDPIAVYEQIEYDARDELMKNGGSLSHHHGVGKLRKKFMPQIMKPTGIEVLKGIKATVDPKNIFALHNLID